MYGLINVALKDMIVKKFGDQVWDTVFEHAGVPEDSFLSMRRYDDAVTFELAAAAAEILKTPINDCMELFGRHWIAEVATKDFASLMDISGQNTIDFLRNLNGLHDRISTTFLGYVPPQFAVQEIDATAGRYTVQYNSERRGLSYFVSGLLAELAVHFGDDLSILEFSVDEHSEGTEAVYEVAIR